MNIILIFSLSKTHCAKKATIHQVTTMLATSKDILFPGHNHLLTTYTDNPSLTGPRVIIKGSGHQYQWLADGYDLDILTYTLHITEVTMAKWLEQTSQWHEVYCHDLEVMSWNPGWVDLGVRSTSVVSRRLLEPKV